MSEHFKATDEWMPFIGNDCSRGIARNYKGAATARSGALMETMTIPDRDNGAPGGWGYSCKMSFCKKNKNTGWTPETLELKYKMARQ